MLPIAEGAAQKFMSRKALSRNVNMDICSTRDIKYRLRQEDYSIQSKNESEILNSLNEIVCAYYNKVGARKAEFFLHSKNEDWGWSFSHFLIDRKHVIKYGFGKDRNFLVGGVELAIGPHYFGPSSFWLPENSKRFSMEFNKESVIKNLALLDEFLGYGAGGVLIYSSL